MDLLANIFLKKEIEQLVLFFMVGGINTLFGYSLYALFLYFGLHYTLASLFSTIGGVLFNFKTTGIIVFKNHNNKLLLKFIGVYAITYLLNIGCLRIFDIVNVNMYLAGAIVLIPVALIAYTLQKRFVFGGNEGEINKRSNSLL